MPAIAKLMPAAGVSMTLTPATTPNTHSLSCSARIPPWQADSAAEQAVSYETQGPFKPRANDSLPDATDRADPVAAYTLLPAGIAASIWANPVEAMPRKTPATLPLRMLRGRLLSCNAA